MADRFRLGFHMMPPSGWLNDPNGLCQFKGTYHVFFQYTPDDPQGGNKYWGHYVSGDLVSWTFEGAPLAPDTPYDRDGVYSGSAVVENGKMYLFYTGNVKEEGEHDYVLSGRQANVLMVESEDGIHFSSKKLLLSNADYPDYYGCHIRDPKIVKDRNGYYMLQGGRDKEDKGRVLWFFSEDLEEWKFAGDSTTEEIFGYMWECPDLLEIDGNYFLAVCPQGLENQEFRFQNVYQSGYFKLNISDKDGEGNDIAELIGRPVEGKFTELDMGFDFYAPQTFLDESGRCIMIGWMGMCDMIYTNPTVEDGWQHCLTVPRELKARNGKILQNPVRELEKLRGREVLISSGDGRVESQSIFLKENMYEIVFEGIGSEGVELVLSEGLEISYRKEEKIFRIHFLNDAGSGRTERKARLDRLDNARILVDRSAVEIFLNDGETVFSTRFYPRSAVLDIRHVAGSAKMWSLNSALIG